MRDVWDDPMRKDFGAKREPRVDALWAVEPPGLFDGYFLFE